MRRQHNGARKARDRGAGSGRACVSSAATMGLDGRYCGFKCEAGEGGAHTEVKSGPCHTGPVLRHDAAHLFQSTLAGREPVRISLWSFFGNNTQTRHTGEPGCEAQTCAGATRPGRVRSEEHTSELQ